MKWYWIVLIVAIVAIATYWIAIKGPSLNKTSCRPGTCPYIRSDGSVFCTAAACKQSVSTDVIVQAPSRTNIFSGFSNSGINNSGVGNVGTGPR